MKTTTLVIQTNPHLADAGKRRQMVLRTTIESAQVEGITVDEQQLRAVAQPPATEPGTAR